MSESTATAPSASAEKKTGTAALDEIFQPFARSDAPGMVVGVAQNGKTIYRRGLGLASMELGVANTPWTRMRIGSTSKHFTCLAALLLAEEGKLDLDVGVTRYLPELPPLKAEPTLRQFMTHTSGLRDYLDLGFIADGLAIKPKGVALPTQVRQGDVNFAPGEKMMYNNGGYHLLSIAIERAAGMPFEQFLKERIFTPLGMGDTASVPSDFEIHRGMAVLHVPLPEGGYRRGIFPTEEVRGEGAMISNVDDMLRWLAHLRGPKIIGSEATWKQMLTTTTLNNGLVNPYALGLMCNPYRGVDTIHHAGGVIGGSCQMITVPEHALDIIIITNGALVSPVDLAQKVIDALLGEALVDAPAPKATIERFKGVIGKRYLSPSSGFVVGFSDAGGQLGMSALNYPAVPVRDEGEQLRLAFEDLAAGPLVFHTTELASDTVAPTALTISEAGHAERFELLPETPPALTEAGQPLVGRYRASDLDAEAQIAFEGDTLKLRIFGAYGVSVMLLEAWSADVFGWRIEGASLPLSGALSVERENGRITRFRANTLRTRHLLFSRVKD